MNNTTKSTVPDLDEIVAAHPFSRGINPRYLHLLTDSASLMHFGAGQDIFREGQSADHFYLIHKGRIALETFVALEGGTTLQTLSAGEALGWSWLFSPYTWHFTARAREPAELVEFGAADLRGKAEENHDFGYVLAMRIGQVMFERLQTTRRRLVEFYTRD
jgi:CRP-like cAMP-binding protein